MTANHTPGPWEVRRDMPEPFPRSPGEAIPFMVMAPRRGPVAEVFAPAGPGWRQRAEANAALIAAAPELLDIIDEMRQAGDRLHQLVGTKAHGEDSKAFWAHASERARAALAKAGIA